MKARSWDSIWRDMESQVLWSSPDAHVVALLPSLRREGVRRVLDLGCGIGRHTALLARSGFEVYAVDSSAYAVEACRERLRAEGVTATASLGSMDALDFADSSLHFVLCWHVVYHGTRADMAAALGEMRRVLVGDGLLCLTLNSTRNKSCGTGVEVEANTFRDPEKPDGQHLHHYSDRRDLRDLLSEWHIEGVEETEEGPTGGIRPGFWHWVVVARNAGAGRI